MPNNNQNIFVIQTQRERQNYIRLKEIINEKLYQYYKETFSNG